MAADTAERLAATDPVARRWRRIGLMAFVAGGFLLITMGGAIAAAPVTLPLMWTATRRHPTGGFRAAGAVIGSLTAAEAAWAVTYLGVGEATPWIWLLPLVAAAATAWVFLTTGRSARRGTPPAPAAVPAS